MADAGQNALLGNQEAPELQKVVNVLVGVLSEHAQPSAWDLIHTIERDLGWKARWQTKTAINEVKAASTSTRARRAYLDSLMESGDLDAAL